jgi:hypothetical protein
LQAAVESAERTALITPIIANQELPPVERALIEAQIAYDFIDVTPNLRVYMFTERLDLSLIAAGLGYQY